jgi:ATP-dependent Lon protease
LIAHFEREREVLTLRHKIQTEAREEMDKAQREYYLRQQLKAIQRELGEASESQALIDEYRQKLDAARLPEEAQAVCRKVAVQIAAQATVPSTVTPELVREYLEREPFVSEVSERLDIPGIATGLAVTAVGGDILFIEATRMQGKGDLTLTEHLGEVMRESAQLA